MGDISNSTVAVGEHISIVTEDPKTKQIKRLERETKDLEEQKNAVNHKLKKARDDARVARNVQHIKQHSETRIMTTFVPLIAVAGASLFAFTIEPIVGLGAGILGLVLFFRYRTNPAPNSKAAEFDKVIEELKAEIEAIETKIISNKNEIRRLDLGEN